MKGLRDGIGRNQAFQIEAMRFSLRAAEFSFERVIGTAKYLEDISQVPDFLRVFALVTDCWSVVDTIKRSREILLHVSGLKRKTDWVQDFLKATSAIEPFRNIMQHIATHIPTLSDQARPIMGAYSWIASSNSNQSHTVWFSASSQQHTVTSLPVDTWTKQFAMDHMFSLDDREISLSAAIIACDEFSWNFENWLSTEDYLSETEIGASIISFNISGMTERSKP